MKCYFQEKKTWIEHSEEKMLVKNVLVLEI